jgi:hypothetical protein
VTGIQDDDAGEQAFYAALNAPVPGEEPRQPSIWQMTEEELLTEVVSRCERYGVASVHIDNAHHSKRRGDLIGFPDLILCGRNGVAFRELKREGPWHSLRPAQAAWKWRLLAAGQDWDIWQPSDLTSGRIDRELAALSRK